MLAVQGYSFSQPRVSFKQNENPQDVQQQSFKTHAGLKIGTALSVIAAARHGLSAKGQSMAAKVGAIDEAAAKATKSKILWTIPITALVYIGCGVILDKLINDKRVKFSQDSASKDMKETIKSDKTADITREGNVYQKSKTGKKYGTLLGLVAFPALRAVNLAIKENKRCSVLGFAINMAVGAVAGRILGSWTDNSANKGAKKFADKAAK
ncbi:hypothetical protein IKR55_01425 [bacterium]|nr:hypothetical protein [bacterium]